MCTSKLALWGSPVYVELFPALDSGPYRRRPRHGGHVIVDQNELLLGTILNRTYGTHKNLYNPPFLLTLFGPI